MGIHVGDDGNRSYNGRIAIRPYKNGEDWAHLRRGGFHIRPKHGGYDG